jgi:protein gp37
VADHPYEQGFELNLWPERLGIPASLAPASPIFVNSMSDLFHEDVPDDFIRDVFQVMGRPEWHTFQILTKRHERLRQLAPKLRWAPNIWMGVGIENEPLRG